jgi:pseudouridylate synthase
MSQFSDYIRVAINVSEALNDGRPTVALESTVITHGLPFPQNLKIARKMEEDIRQIGAIPATIAVLDGQIFVGLDDTQLQRLAVTKDAHKISRRDYGPALALRWSGGTTVAATMQAASSLGIPVFATGGIGGVHRQPPYDISADLLELARTPIIVVCAGAKAILDLNATVEFLETVSVPVIGYQTDDFPAFYSRSSGLPVTTSAGSPEQIVAIARAHWALGNNSAVLVVNPLTESSALPPADIEVAVIAALKEAEGIGLRGKAVTPFLLARVSALTGGASLDANLDLLQNNAKLGAEISKCWCLTETKSAGCD